jgi:nuclear pore complex protein Nup160
LISLHDGGLLKLTRHEKEEWKETFYNEGGWRQGLKSLVPFSSNNSLKFGKTNIEYSAVTSLVAPETQIDGDHYAFSVSIDHRIRVWNLDTGKICYTGDMLGHERLPQEQGKWVIHPSQSQLIRVIHDVDDRTILVTYSPIGAGEFKFWSMVIQQDGSVELDDLFPDTLLRPSTPTSDVWTLAEFAVSQSTEEKGKVSLWVLWKNNITYRTFTVDLNLLSPSSSASAWKFSWNAATVETLPDSPLPTVQKSDPADPSEKWLGYILYPGRYSLATVETALAIYERSLGSQQKSNGKSSKSLTERICLSINANAALNDTYDDSDDADHHKAAADAQWRRFYRLVVELDKQRGEALSLDYDYQYQLPAVVTADGVSVIRDCSDVEQLWHNPDNTFGGRKDQVSNLISAAAAFRENFTDVLQRSCRNQLDEDVYEEPTLTDTQRLQAFYDRCDFAGQIGDDDFNQLFASLGGSFKNVTNAVYESLVQALRSQGGAANTVALAAYGRRVAVRGVQEIVELYHSICFDQLCLLAFIEGEIDQEEEGMSLDTGKAARQLLDMLKRLELLDWMSRRQITVSTTPGQRSIGTPVKETPERDEKKTVTLVEGALYNCLALSNSGNAPASSVITDLLLGICDATSDVQIPPHLLQCFLLTEDRPDLAKEVSRFCDQRAFSTYIQGRVALANKELESAAVRFKKAAFGCGKSDGSVMRDLLLTSQIANTDPHGLERTSSGLLTDIDWAHFECGLPSYYAHIITLFAGISAHSHVIDFCRLTLQFLPHPLQNNTNFPGALAEQESDKQKKKREISEKQQKKDEGIRTDTLSRLFSAAVHTARFDVAAGTLHRIPDAAIQLSCLRTLVLSMIEAGCGSQLLSLPLIGMEQHVNAVLSQKCSQTTDVYGGTNWHAILYAWRIQRADFRGAASAGYERIQKLKSGGRAWEGDMLARRDNEDEGPFSSAEKTNAADELDTPVTREYLRVINALACVEENEAWILVEPLPAKLGQPTVGKRRVLDLQGLRKEYEVEMDRVEALRRGKFGFGDVDMSGI